MRELNIEQLQRKVDSLNTQVSTMKEENISLKTFYKVIKKRAEEGSIQFSDMSAVSN